MSYLASLNPKINQSGARVVWADEENELLPRDHQTAWWTIWSEILHTHTHAVKQLQQSTGSCIVFVSLVSSTVAAEARIVDVKEALNYIEIMFGSSATNLAKILRVSRPMIYKYRKGMKQTVKNNRRMQDLAKFSYNWSSVIEYSFEAHLKTLQPEGKTLLDFLSAEQLDFILLNHVLLRCLDKSRNDRILREALAEQLGRDKPIEERLDIVHERHAAGKPVYVGDPNKPGKLIQLQPDGRRIRGSLENRKFIPDEQ